MFPLHPSSSGSLKGVGLGSHLLYLRSHPTGRRTGRLGTTADCAEGMPCSETKSENSSVGYAGSGFLRAVLSRELGWIASCDACAALLLIGLNLSLEIAQQHWVSGHRSAPSPMAVPCCGEPGLPCASAALWDLSGKE